MKRITALLLAVLFAALVFAACGKKKQQGEEMVVDVVDVYTPVPASGDPDQTQVPIVTIAPTVLPTDTPEPTAAPTPVPTEADQSVFDDAVFIGNSVFEGLYRFGVITHGKFYTKVGLNVNSVFTASIENSSVPVIDELNTGTYGKVILYFGTNELGWPSLPTFAEKYAGVVEAVRQRQPGCTVYVCGVLPTSKAVDAKNQNGINNTNVRTMNGLLEEMCRETGAVFIEVPASCYDAEGFLPEDASSDGIHLNLNYDRIWAEHICLKVMGII